MVAFSPITMEDLRVHLWSPRYEMTTVNPMHSYLGLCPIDFKVTTQLHTTEEFQSTQLSKPWVPSFHAWSL